MLQSNSCFWVKSTHTILQVFRLTTSGLFTAAVTPVSVLHPISYIPCFHPSLLHPAPPSHPCCHSKPVFLHTSSLCWSHKYPILPRTPACYCCLSKSPSQTNKSKPETDSWSVTEIAIPAKPSEAKADQQEIRWAWQTSVLRSWKLRTKLVTYYLQRQFCTTSLLQKRNYFLFDSAAFAYSWLGRSCLQSSVELCSPALLWVDSCNHNEPCGKLVPDLENFYFQLDQLLIYENEFVIIRGKRN